MCFVGPNQLLIVVAMVHISNVKEAESRNGVFLTENMTENTYD